MYQSNLYGIEIYAFVAAIKKDLKVSIEPLWN